uniref:preprotein translocase subunit YajC n=1 Tax=Neisseria sicca TaxID=490 RepID=UPI003F68B229
MGAEEKKLKGEQGMVGGLKVGDKVVLGGGLKGGVRKVGEEFLSVEIGEGGKREV